MEKITREEAQRIKSDQQNKQLLATLKQLLDRPEEQWKNEIIAKLGKELQAVAAAISKIPAPQVSVAAPNVQVATDHTVLIGELQKLMDQFNQKFESLDSRLEGFINRPDMEMTFTRNANGYIQSPITFKAVK
jgi:hypothetical protein